MTRRSVHLGEVILGFSNYYEFQVYFPRLANNPEFKNAIYPIICFWKMDQGTVELIDD